jgi:WD40 repeat protein
VGRRPAASWRRPATNAGVALSADGVWPATAGKRTAVWDVRSHQPVLELPEQHSTVWAMAWSPDRELLAVGSSDGGLVIWNIQEVLSQLRKLGLD